MNKSDKFEIPRALDDIHIDKKISSHKFVVSSSEPSANIADLVLQQSIINVQTNDKTKVKIGLHDMMSLLLFDPSYAMKISPSVLNQIINHILNGDNAIKSIGFRLLVIFMQRNPESIAYILNAFSPILVDSAIILIPAKYSCDFLIELLKYSKLLPPDHSNNIISYFISHNFHNIILSLFYDPLATFNTLQINVINILYHLPRNLFDQENFDQFIRFLPLIFKHSRSAAKTAFLKYLESFEDVNFYLSLKEVAFIEELFIMTCLIPKENNESITEYNDYVVASFKFLLKCIFRDRQIIKIFTDKNLRFDDKLYDFLTKTEVELSKQALECSVTFFIEILNSDYQICESFAEGSMLIWAEHELSKGNYHDQILALRIVATLAKFTLHIQKDQPSCILYILQKINPISTMTDYLSSGSDNDLLLKLLVGIYSMWKTFLTNFVASDVLSEAVSLMGDDEFKQTLYYLTESEDEYVSDEAQIMIKYIDEVGFGKEE
ncbi:hypothetical protein TRFO_16835 [Tritrichomonas foetus]|uniref:Uncharacterized protein n=1 Tax=Tritrichomonas foetus TaxID=1144522 RepID=A0A1J4KUJ1_9EUKA|nr:hypothetical protein TRFO_16835 [Tritrichomonas foetus]|eukprot:OHT13165.1 hypothetical protein TRFO_16835 [Tritrichomonas foetus]